MNRYITYPVEAVQVAPDNLMAVADWVCPPPGRPGIYQYGTEPARLRTLRGELSAELGSWIVRFGHEYIVISAESFETAFYAQP